MQRSRRTGRALLGALLLALAVPAGVLATPAASTSYHGINGQFLWDPAIVGAGPPADAFRATQLEGMRAEGLALVRHGAPWSLMEQAPPLLGVRSYQWAYGDTVAATLAARGQRWYPVLGAPPLWATGLAFPPLGCPGSFAAPAPSATADLAAFAAAFARRYGPGGAFWAANRSLTPLPVRAIELFNEPNMGCFFNTGADDAPARYAAIYAATRTAVRAVAPATTVVAGGLAPGPDNVWTRMVTPVTFVTRMFAARPALASELDALGMHPYAPDAPQTFAQIAAMRATLDPRTPGRKVPIEVTEAGWFTQGSLPGDFWNLVPPITEARRATMLQTLASELPASNCVVTRLIPHTWISPELNPASFIDWFGIVGRNGVKKASATAFGAGLRTARVATAAPPLSRCP
jgi:hypothetical protein